MAAQHTHPDPDEVQKELTLIYIACLLCRLPEQSVDAITQKFGNDFETSLRWLGNERQDDMIREAMRETGIDLSHWLED